MVILKVKKVNIIRMTLFYRFSSENDAMWLCSAGLLELAKNCSNGLV